MQRKCTYVTINGKEFAKKEDAYREELRVLRRTLHKSITQEMPSKDGPIIDWLVKNVDTLAPQLRNYYEQLDEINEAADKLTPYF